MTHLSGFSYLQRAVLEVYTYAFLMSRIWENNRFRCLHPEKILAGELRSLATIAYLITIPLQFTWDVTSTWIKYTESIVLIPNITDAVPKPFVYWSSHHQDVAMSIDYIECITLSLQTSIFFLMQCFWHYISRTIAKRSFMSSWEFRFYIVWAVGSAAVFPTLQWYYRNNVIKREAAPQLVYSLEVLIAAVLGIQTHFRFKRIIKITRDVKKENEAVIERLDYFKDMNFLQTIALFFFSISLVILCIDGHTEAMVINNNKFASDLLIANLDTCSIILWLIGISIFHSRPVSNEAADAFNDQRSNQDTEGGTRNRLNGQPIYLQIGEIPNEYTTPFMGSASDQPFGQFLKPMSPVAIEFPVRALDSEGLIADLCSKHCNIKGPSDPLPLPPSPFHTIQNDTAFL